MLTKNGMSARNPVTIVAGPGKVSVSTAVAVAPDGLMAEAPKASGSDEACICPQAPEPLSGIVCEPPGTLSVRVRVPVLGTSPDEGVNFTVIVQALLMASVAGARGQLSTSPKSPVAVTELSSSGAVPVLVKVTSLVVTERTGSCGNWRDGTESVAADSGSTYPTGWLRPGPT